MSITKSAKKAFRASSRKKTFNDRRRREMRAVVKNVRALAGEKKHTDAGKLLSSAYKAIDKAAKRGIIKKNTASRKKSRLALLANNAHKK